MPVRSTPVLGICFDDRPDLAVRSRTVKQTVVMGIIAFNRLLPSVQFDAEVTVLTIKLFAISYVFTSGAAKSAAAGLHLLLQT